MSAKCLRCSQKLAHLDHSRGICDYLPSPREQKPRARLNPRSPQMRDFYREERIPLIEAVLKRDGYQCMILSPWHERLSDWNPLTVHERLTRGRGGGIMAEGVNTMENCVSACRLCNEAVSRESEWAEANGWIVKATT